MEFFVLSKNKDNHSNFFVSFFRFHVSSKLVDSEIHM